MSVGDLARRRGFRTLLVGQGVSALGDWMGTIAFMALASNYIAKLLARHHWIAWIGLLIVLYVAVEMVWTGSQQIGCRFVPQGVCSEGPLATFAALL